jgi:hypothetical protein
MVNSLAFDPAPTRDPFLSFRVDEAQVHPLVFINLQTQLRNPTDFGFSADTEPTIDLQATISSRVFGDTR